MQKAMSDVRALFLEKNLRLTPQREAILRILLECQDKHLTAEDIYDRTRTDCPDIGLATVYRTLELFEELNLVSRLEFGDSGRRYEFCFGVDHHHLLCTDCGHIEEFSEELLNGDLQPVLAHEFQEKLARESGFLITHHSLRFFGYCSRCRSKHEGGHKE